VTWLAWVILAEWILTAVGAGGFLVLYGRPWRYEDRVMAWHLTAVTAVAGLEAFGLLLAVVLGELPLIPTALVYGAGAGIVYWRVALLVAAKRRERRGRSHESTEAL
jgi:CHASE2 domain-containing sensor protein